MDSDLTDGRPAQLGSAENRESWQATLDSLYAWLLDDREVNLSGRLVPITEVQSPGRLGASLEVISFVASTSVGVASLLVSLAQWFKTTRATASPPPIAIEVRATGTTIRIGGDGTTEGATTPQQAPRST